VLAYIVNKITKLTLEIRLLKYMSSFKIQIQRYRSNANFVINHFSFLSSYQNLNKNFDFKSVLVFFSELKSSFDVQVTLVAQKFSYVNFFYNSG